MEIHPISPILPGGQQITDTAARAAVLGIRCFQQCIFPIIPGKVIDHQWVCRRFRCIEDDLDRIHGPAICLQFHRADRRSDLIQRCLAQLGLPLPIADRLGRNRHRDALILPAKQHLNLPRPAHQPGSDLLRLRIALIAIDCHKGRGEIAIGSLHGFCPGLYLMIVQL